MDAADRVFAPLDAVRRLWLRALGRFAPHLLSNRGARIAVLGTFSIALTLSLSVARPIMMVALGPLLFGVPHLVSDVRYLVAKPRLHRRWAFWGFVALPLAMASIPSARIVAPLSWIGGCLVARCSRTMRGVALVMATVAAAVYIAGGAMSEFVFAHAHNFVAALLVLVVFTRSRTHALVPIAVFILFSIALLGGVFDQTLLSKGALTGITGGATLYDAVRHYARYSIPGPAALRLVALFVFAQGVHYLLWLRVIPDESRERPGIRSFGSSFRALQRDTGLVFLCVAGALWALFALWGWFAAEDARLAYLHLASFHGHLEIAFLAIALLEGPSLTLSPSPPA